MRSRCDSTFASLHRSRCVTSDFDISSVKSATGTSCRSARFAATQRPSADFPMLGRAAMMTRLPGWNPEVSRSRSRKPGRHAGDVGAGLVQSGDALEAFLQQLLDVAELGGDPALRKVEDDLLGPVDQDLRLAWAFPAELGDLLSRGDEPAQRRHLADDARVVPCVGGRRHECRQLVHTNPTADGLELAAFLELVDERDRVDRLAFRIEREARAVDLRVALTVEVGGIEDLAHRPDRARGEQHRPEDRFLGLEVLGWRNRSGFCELGDRCHSLGVNHPRALCFHLWEGEFSTCPFSAFCSGKEHMFPYGSDGAC